MAFLSPTRHEQEKLNASLNDYNFKKWEKETFVSFMSLPWVWTQPGVLIGNYYIIKSSKL